MKGDDIKYARENKNETFDFIGILGRLHYLAID